MKRAALSLLVLPVLIAGLFELEAGSSFGEEPQAGPRQAKIRSLAPSLGDLRSSAARAPAGSRQSVPVAPAPMEQVLEARGRLSVTLLNADTGTALDQGRFQVRSNGRTLETCGVGSAGSVTLDVPLGELEFWIDPGSLPNGLLPPARQDLRGDSIKWPELFTPRVQLSAGDSHADVDLVVFEGARIYGRVHATNAAPVDASWVVQCESTRMDRPLLAYSGFVDEEGYYEHLVLPGSYRIRSAGQRRPGDPCEGRRPLPVDVQLERGQHYLLDFEVAPGRGIVQGRSLDPALLPGEEPQLWEGILVALKPYDASLGRAINRRPYRSNDTVAKTHTDASGSFQLDRLLPGKYALTFGYDEFRNRGEIPRIGAWIDPVIVEVHAEGVIDIGDVYLPRSRPCVVVGHLDAGGLDPSEVQIEIEFPENSLSTMEPYKLAVEADAWGGFEFWAHTSPDATPAIVRCKRRVDPGWAREQELTLIPNGVQSLTLELL